MHKNLIGVIQIHAVTPSVNCLQPLVSKMDFLDGVIQHNSAPSSVDMWL